MFISVKNELSVLYHLLEAVLIGRVGVGMGVPLVEMKRLKNVCHVFR